MSLSLEAVEEINLIRGLLEAEAIRLAIANMAEDLLDRMDVINEERPIRTRPTMCPVLWASTTSFISPCSTGPGLPRLRQHIEALWKSADVYRTSIFNDLNARLRTLSEHNDLIDACWQRNPTRAVRVMDAHRNKAVETLSTLLKEPDPGPDGETEAGRVGSDVGPAGGQEDAAAGRG